MVRKYEAYDPKYEHTLSFSSNEVTRLRRPHDNALVIYLNIANALLRRMLIDTGSYTNILFLSVLKEMGIENAKIDRVQNNLVSFSREQTTTLGIINFLFYAEDMNLMVTFMVID